MIEKIRKPSRNYKDLQAYVVDLLKKIDKNGDGYISIEEFSAGLKQYRPLNNENRMEIYLTTQEERTLLRTFDHNRNGMISMEEFFNTLANNS